MLLILCKFLSRNPRVGGCNRSTPRDVHDNQEFVLSLSHQEFLIENESGCQVHPDLCNAVAVHVSKDRCSSSKHDAVCSRWKRHSRNDYSVTGSYVQSEHCGVKGSSCITYSSCMVCTNLFRKLLFKLLYIRTCCEPNTLENVDGSIYVVFAHGLAPVW